MTYSQKLIVLDRRVPFVDMVRAVSCGEEPIENGAYLLSEIERKHGLKVVSNDFYVGEKDVLDEWCKDALFPFLTETHFVITGGDLFTSCQIYDVRDYEIHGPETSFTWREWGHWLARWANESWVRRPLNLGKTDWSRKKRGWNYLDFYNRGYLNYQIEDYDEWADTLIRIIHKKTDLQKSGL